MKYLFFLVLFMMSPKLLAQSPPEIPLRKPEAVGMDAAPLNLIDDIVQEGLEQDKMPGCVVIVGRREGIAFRRAYGFRQVQPEKVTMTVNTVFDLASLTKPIATATSVMALIQQGKLDPNATVATYLPEFAQNGKETITIRHLLTHTGGLIADNSMSDYANGGDEAIARIYGLRPTAAPGESFTYSDVGFIVLGQVVKTVSGKNLHEFSQEQIFHPLHMQETGYLPNDELKARAAVTELREGQWMQGEVHDPRAFALNGIAGHAGLFSTADDLARYATMMLGGGRLNDVQILDQSTYQLMTTAVEIPRGRRALGWDVKTGYSSNRSDLMSSQAFGHGGFTGTGIWIDPVQNLYVIFLSNRVHPNGKGLVNPLIGRIGTIASAAILQTTDREVRPAPEVNVLNGIDVLERSGFSTLKGHNVGLITNQTGLNRDGVSTIRLIHEADGVTLKSLFSPEHGLEGKLDIPKIGDQQDAVTGLKVFSLYGETRIPTADSLEGIDTLIFDIQDIGCRFYTYVSTMGNAMKAAGEHQIRFVVLDRVNPISGVDVQGPVLDEGDESFVGFHSLPVRHGMTAGELASMFRAELKLDVDLEIVPVEGWQRNQMFDQTGLLWTNPSPNMRSLTQAILYPGVGLLEMTNVSVGRGTETPFEVVGAPWIEARRFAAHLNNAGLGGVRFVPVRFVPASSKYTSETCNGVHIIITDRAKFHPLSTGIQLMCSLKAMYSEEWDRKNLNTLLCSGKTVEAIEAGRSVNDIEPLWAEKLARFLNQRRRFLRYE
ncbi:MAG: exo-beta-N-acetylmuramidase NamZ domain-containing protein [Planctomycetaceae bacterium]